MLKNFHTNFGSKTFITILFILIILSGFFAEAALAQWADHLVISAVQITEGEGKTNHDFVEIYNPTLNDINLKGYRLVKRTKTGTSDTSIKSWTDDAVIKAHSWRLWASSDDEAYSLRIGTDDATKQTIAPDNGIAIRLGASDTGEVIDSVTWGAAENIFKEGMAAPIIGASESLVRKPGAESAGNGEDTNNNAGDFFVMTNFIPHNSQSIAAPAVENLPEPSLSPVPTLGPSPFPGSSPAASVSLAQQNLPAAEAGIDREAVIGENIDFDGSDSFDPQGKELVFIWDFGDKTSAKGMNVSHIYNAIGEYNVILKTDNGENISEDSLKVKITAPEFSDKIILSEVLPNPTGADKDSEWFELFNFGDKRINLRGWILESSSKTGGKRYIFSGDNYIEAKGYLVIKRSESGLVLTNESGTVTLLWPADKIISEAIYGAAKEGQSYAFINNTWQWVDIPSPGKVNSAKNIITAVPNQKASSVSTVNKSFVVGRAFSDEDALAENRADDTALVKSTIAQFERNFNAEEFLERLIEEKVDNAILNAKTKEIAPQEKMVALGENTGESGIITEGKDSNCESFCSNDDKNFAENKQNIRNNPWFYGDIALSFLSLFLVWRYQEVRKKLKN